MTLLQNERQGIPMENLAQTNHTKEQQEIIVSRKNNKCRRPF